MTISELTGYLSQLELLSLSTEHIIDMRYIGIVRSFSDTTHSFYKGIFGNHVHLYYFKNELYFDFYFHNRLNFSIKVDDLTETHIIKEFDKGIGNIVGGDAYLRWKIALIRSRRNILLNDILDL